MTTHLNPHQIAAMAALERAKGADEVAQLRAQLHELTCRVEDLAALVATHMQTSDPDYDQPPPAAVALIEWYGACPHGRVLRFGCRQCGTKEYPS